MIIYNKMNKSYLLELLENHKEKFTDMEYKNAIEELGGLTLNKKIKVEFTFLKVNIESGIYDNEDDDDDDTIFIGNHIETYKRIIKINLDISRNFYDKLIDDMGILRSHGLCKRHEIDDEENKKDYENLENLIMNLKHRNIEEKKIKGKDYKINCFGDIIIIDVKKLKN